MKSCFFCYNCCFQNLKVEFGFRLPPQAQLCGPPPTHHVPGLHLRSSEVEGHDRLPLSRPTWAVGGGRPQVHWLSLGKAGVGSASCEGLTLEGTRGASSCLGLTQLRLRVSDAIRDAGTRDPPPPPGHCGCDALSAGGALWQRLAPREP